MPIQTSPTCSTDQPLLETMLDADSMASEIREILGTRRAVGRIVSIDLISRRRGKRAVVAYELASSHSQPFWIYGKHFTEPERARRLYDVMTSLSTVARSPFDVPRPLAWLPELSAVFYVPARGRDLRGAVADGHVTDLLRRCGESVAALHGVPMELDRTLDLRRELSNVRSWTDVVAATFPAHAEVALEVSDRLHQGALKMGSETGVPIHKDLRYDHIVVGSRVTFIDLDEMRTGDPSFDLAHFCVYLDLLAIRSDLSRSRLEALRDAFLAAYAESTPWVPNYAFDYYRAYSCLKVASQLCRVTGVRPWPEGDERRRQLRAILGEGRAAARELS